MRNNDARLDAIGQIRDIVRQTTAQEEAFLYYLPELLSKPEFSNIEADKALMFAQSAIGHGRPQVITDALKILNQFIDPRVGSLQPVGRNSFIDNHSFHWSELGTFTNPIQIITHILNKATFELTLGK